MVLVSRMGINKIIERRVRICWNNVGEKDVNMN